MIKLDVRLSTVAGMVEKCEYFTDIGSDHAYLPIFLLKNEIICKALITDLRSGPLKNSEANSKKYGVYEHCKFALGSGLAPLKDEKIDCAAICGMGGETIIEILSENLSLAENIPSLILQPMSDYVKLKRFLYSNGFDFRCERIVRDEHLFYHIFSVFYTGKEIAVDEKELEFSEELFVADIPVMKEFIKGKLYEQNLIDQGLENSSNESLKKQSKERISYLKTLTQKYETL